MPQLPVVILVAIPVETRRAFDKDHDEDYDRDSASQMLSRCMRPKRLGGL